MGNDCYTTVALPLSRIAHCITASLATLAANPDAALLIMTSPNDVALVFLMSMLDCVETENFEQAGHVKASACAGVAFLACHPIGAEGDECMFGPFRQKLLGLGAFGALLRAALSSVLESDCDRIIQQVRPGGYRGRVAAGGVRHGMHAGAGVAYGPCTAWHARGCRCGNARLVVSQRPDFLAALAMFPSSIRARLHLHMPRPAAASASCCTQAAAIGLMYLSTMAGAVDAAELAMYAALLTDSDNSEMIEFLMAGMWILLRDGNNRKVRGPFLPRFLSSASC